MEKEKWYKKSWFMWVLLIFFPPAGIIFMWVMKKDYSQKKKAILSVVSALWFFLIIGLNASNNNENPKETTIQEETTEKPTTKEKTTEVSTTEKRISLDESKDINEYLSILTKGVKKNSNAMVDKIAAIAKEDAITAKEKDLANAVSYISDHFNNYFSNSETMEAVMYYGYLLDYSYDDNTPESALGTDVWQVVKYAYRGEKDDSIDENLRQIQKDLDALGIRVEIPKEKTNSEEGSSDSAKEITDDLKEQVYSHYKQLLSSDENPFNWLDTGSDLEAWNKKVEEYENKSAEETAKLFGITVADVNKIYIEKEAASVKADTTQSVATQPITTQTPTTQPSAPTATHYVLNTNTHKFHYPSCRDVDNIAPQNYADFSGTRDEAIAQGYSPCGHCHP